MVKRQKEKQYQSARENRANAQLRSGAVSHSQTQQILPFSCCALTLTPFASPVCTAYAIENSGKKMQMGMVFDESAILPFVKKHGKDPVTGDDLGIRDVITLHMDATDAQDSENRHDTRRWQCPVLNKPFSDRHSKVVAIRDRETKSAYVYSYEAYQELNVKPKSYIDLTTGKKFHPKKDVLILFDPENETLNKKRDVGSFWHIQHKRALGVSGGSIANNNVKHGITASRIMEQLQKEKTAKAEKEAASRKRAAEAMENAADKDEPEEKRLKIYADDVTGVSYTSAQAATSLTSTSMSYSKDGSNTTRLATPEEILQSQFRVMRQRRQKGYVQLETNLGILLLELHCDIAPRTCTNFLGLAAKGAFDNTIFHRLIQKFMIQGGSKRLKSDGDDAKEDDSSLWGEAFRDEFDDRLKHTGKGVVSMANAGSNTNKRQFFITFRSCPHLDRKHSIFGQIVEGENEALAQMESRKTDKKDRPIEPIILLKTNILADPAKEAQNLERERILERHKQRDAENARKMGAASKAKPKPKGPDKNRVGKYLSAAIAPSEPAPESSPRTDEAIPPVIPKIKSKKPPPSKTKFGNFDGW